MRDKNDPLKLNQIVVSLADFMESYNKSVPINFPRVSVKTLKHFQTLYPILFKHTGGWSIDKHRKKLMDWLTSTTRV